MYQYFVKTCIFFIFQLIGLNLLAQGTFSVTPKPDSIDCNSSDLVSKAINWYNTSGGAIIGGNNNMSSIRASIDQNTFLSKIGQLQDQICEKDRKIFIVFTIINSNGSKGDSISTYFKLNDDGIRSLQNPDLNRRDTCFDGVEQRLIAWMNNGGNGKVTTSCSGSTGWTDYIYNGSDGSSGSGKINVGPYPRIPSNACGWTLNVTFFAQDSCGNRRGFPGRYILIDNQPPTLDQVLRDITISCETKIDTLLKVKDACDRQPILNYKVISTQGSDNQNCNFYNYILIREWIATDRCGNKDTFNQNVVIQDMQPPVINLLEDLTITCENLTNLDSLLQSVIDNCSSTNISYKDSLISTACVDLYYRRYEAKDICGNVSHKDQKLYILKNSKPNVISEPNVLILDCKANEQNAYDQWLDNLGGLEVSSFCTEVKFAFGLKDSFAINDTSTWSILPPTIGQLQELKSDTAFFIIAYTPCGESIAIPVIYIKNALPKFKIAQKSICKNDSINVEIENILVGDLIEWSEVSMGITSIILGNNTPFLTLKIRNENVLIIAKIQRVDCAFTFFDTLSIKDIFTSTNITKPMDLNLCEGDSLVLNSPNIFETLFWVDPQGKVFSGDSLTLSDGVEKSDEGVYKHFVVNNGCFSDTVIFEVRVRDKPTFKSFNLQLETCTGGSLVLKGQTNNYDSLKWYFGSVNIATSTNDSIVINKVNKSNEGKYSVQAFNGLCKSDSSLYIEVKVNNGIQVDFEIDETKCDGDSLILSTLANDFQNIIWILPSQDSIKLKNPTVKGLSGLYTFLGTTKEGCEAKGSRQVTFKAKPEIDSVFSNFIPCDTILQKILFQSVVKKADTNAQFVWYLPDGKVINTQQLEVDNKEMSTGIYKLVVVNGKCASDSATIEISRNSAAKEIKLTLPPFFCDLDTIEILSEPGFALYHLIINNQVIAKNSFGTFKYLPLNADTIKVGVEAFNGNCLAGVTKTMSIIPGEKPLKVEIQPTNLQICLADSLRLDVLNPSNLLEYIWYLPTGKTVKSPTLRIIDLPNNLTGQYSVVAKKGNCISDLSVPVGVTVRAAIPIPNFASSIPSICDDGTSNIKFCLSEVPTDQNINYVIEQLPSRKKWAEGRDTCYDRPGSTLEPNTNRLRLYATKDGCTSHEFNEVNINYTLQPDIKANIIANALAICNAKDSIRLFNETPIDTLQVTWRVFSSAKLTILPKNEIGLSNLSKGLNRVILTISFLNCRNFSMDTIDLLVGLEPKIRDTILQIIDDDPVLIPLVNYDSIGTYYFVNMEPIEGGDIVKIDNRYFIKPKRFYAGVDTLHYTICFGDCVDQCKKGKVILNFAKEIICDIPNIITPNGDGMNDYFVLPCLGNEEWGRVDLFIFDQWGNEVFRSLDYKNDFDGRLSNELLPSDTYYYLLKPNKLDETFTGFLIIKS